MRVYRDGQSRPIYVVEDLDELHGPTSGPVTLPSWLRDPGNTGYVNAADPRGQRSIARQVVAHASSVEDLTMWLTAPALRGVWSDIRIPMLIRETWHVWHPSLRQPLVTGEGEVRRVLAPVHAALDLLIRARDHETAVILAWLVEELGAHANAVRDELRRG